MKKRTKMATDIFNLYVRYQRKLKSKVKPNDYIYTTNQ